MSPMLLKLGNLEVYRVPEVTVAYAPTFLFKALPQGFIDSHRDNPLKALIFMKSFLPEAENLV